MSLKAGTLLPAQFHGSMAAAIENAFEIEWQKLKNESPPSAMREYWQVLFVAVAQGVVRHLRDHPEAFDVTVATDGSSEVQIETTGTLHPGG